MEKPNCHLGYTYEQLQDILGSRLDEFSHWMVGQTMSICEGQQYNYEKKDYEPTNCGPHGMVVYPWDLQRFLHGKPVID